MLFSWSLVFFSDFCIKTDELFEFLDGALDGWPEWSTKRKRTNNESFDCSNVSNSESHENTVEEEVSETNKGVNKDDEESHEDTAKDETSEPRKDDNEDEVRSPEWVLSEHLCYRAHWNSGMPN